MVPSPGRARGWRRKPQVLVLLLHHLEETRAPITMFVHSSPGSKAEFMDPSWHQQCQAFPSALQVKCVMQHCSITTWWHPHPQGRGSSWIMHGQTPLGAPHPRARAALQRLVQETSQTFAQFSTHVSLSSVHRPAPGADARGRCEGVSQPCNIRAALPDQSKGPTSPPQTSASEII